MGFAGGIATTIAPIACALMWMMAAFRTNLRSPEYIQLLMALWLYAGFFLNLTFPLTAAQVLAVGFAAMLDRRAGPLYPKWLACISFANRGFSCR
jgi:hypothetical protein